MEAKKRLGQNFLTDQSAISSILNRFNAQSGEPVVEIGPGRGALTAGLLKSGALLTAVEFDRDMVSILKNRFGTQEHFSIIQADILKITLSDCHSAGPVRVIGNLPYNISSPILFHLLNQIDSVKDMYFMLQKEVVERIVADPGNRDYGRPSIMLQRSFETTMDVVIEPESFTPPPKVRSAMLRLVPRQQPIGGRIDVKLFERVVTQAFSQRRKTLRNTLKGLATSEQMESVGIDPGQRAESVDVAGFTRLVAALESSAMVAG